MCNSKNSYKHADRIADETAQSLTRLPKCATCAGKKFIRPMFHVLPCDDCMGTGIDISDPVAVIQMQCDYLQRAREVIIAQRHTIYELTTTPSERMAIALEKFYSAIKRMD